MTVPAEAELDDVLELELDDDDSLLELLLELDDELLLEDELDDDSSNTAPTTAPRVLNDCHPKSIDTPSASS